MLLRVDPLRRELGALEKKAQDTKVRGEEMTRIIQELEQSITQYKEEYAVLISEANAIKADLATVEAKVESSSSLLFAPSLPIPYSLLTFPSLLHSFTPSLSPSLLSPSLSLPPSLSPSFSHHSLCLPVSLSLPQVDRSKALLASLADEKERWEAGSETFKSQMSTISGDVLLTSAFMAYGG